MKLKDSIFLTDLKSYTKIIFHVFLKSLNFKERHRLNTLKYCMVLNERIIETHRIVYCNCGYNDLGLNLDTKEEPTE